MTNANLSHTQEAQTTVTAHASGPRIKAARESLGMTQDALSASIDIGDLQTIPAIEKGERKVKPQELVKIASALECSIDYFIDPFVVAGEAEFSWRADDRVPEETQDAIQERAGRWIGMLRFLRRSQSGPVQPFSSILRLTIQSTCEEALVMGESVAETLELGSIPAERLVERLESTLDIPVLFIDAAPSPDGHSGFSGATCHLPDMGVILINRNESPARRNFDVAHELFHALTWDAMKPDHRESNSQVARGKTRRIEQLADNFASGLLMPSTSLDKLIDARAIGDISHLAEVAERLQVSPKALAWRLFNAKRIDEATRHRLCEETSRTIDTAKPKRFSASFVGLVHAGIDHGHVSARKAAKTLGLTLADLAGLFEEHSKPSPFAM
jgi:Zn-dependent peptidase ImmA (M78 family)/DNA-binding XRE family transcriptional regulator